jgi:hypothetical protein
LRDRPWRLLLVSVGTTFRTDSWRPPWGPRALKVNLSSTPSMVIRTEYRGTRYSMGSSDPLPAGFEIRFGGLNFQATGNDYLMRLTNREELRARRQAGSAPVSAARVAATPTPASTDAAGPSAPRRRRRSGQRSRQARSERRHAKRVASQRGAPVSTTTAAPTGGARSPDHASPSVCAAQRLPTLPMPAPTRRCAEFPLAATSWLPGTLAPLPATSRP